MAITGTEPALDPAATIGRRRWWALGFLSFGVTMVMIDTTIVNVAIPAVSADLNLVPTDIEWINSAYALVFAALLITMGKTGDVVGRRKIFVTGAALFVTASVIAATAQNGPTIIAGRALQGVGGAMMIPASVSLLNTLFRGKDRAIAFAAWGATIGTTAALGPLLGGFLTTNFSWRWAFLINIPIAVIAITATLLLCPESKDHDALPGIDVAGVLLSIVGLGALIFGLIEGQNFGWWSPRGDVSLGPIHWPFTSLSPVPLAFVVSALAIYAFVRVEARRAALGKVVILDLTLFAIRSFAWGQIAGMVIMFGEFGMILTLPLFLQNILGYSAMKAGATVALIMVGALLAAPASGKVTQAKGPVFVVRVGLVFEVVGMIGIALNYSASVDQINFAPWLMIFGAGIGLSTAQLMNVILRDVPMNKSGQASGTQSTSRQVGTALGVAVLGAVLWTSLGHSLNNDLQKAGIDDAAKRSAITDLVVQSSGTVINSPDIPQQAALVSRFGPQVQHAAQDAYATATRNATLVGAAFVSLAFIGVAGARRAEDDEDDVTTPAPEGVAAAG